MIESLRGAVQVAQQHLEETVRQQARAPRRRRPSAWPTPASSGTARPRRPEAATGSASSAIDLRTSDRSTCSRRPSGAPTSGTFRTKRSCRSSPLARPVSSNAKNDVIAWNDRPSKRGDGLARLESCRTRRRTELATVTGQHRSVSSESMVTVSRRLAHQFDVERVGLRRRHARLEEAAAIGLSKLLRASLRVLRSPRPSARTPRTARRPRGGSRTGPRLSAAPSARRCRSVLRGPISSTRNSTFRSKAASVALADPVQMCASHPLSLT